MTVDLASVTRSWLARVADRTRAEVTAICGDHPPVHALVQRVLTDSASELSASRLLPMAVAGALTDEPDAGPADLRSVAAVVGRGPDPGRPGSWTTWPTARTAR